MTPATIEKAAFNHNESQAMHNRIAPVNTDRSRRKIAVPLRLERKCNARSFCVSKSMATKLILDVNDVVKRDVSRNCGNGPRSAPILGRPSSPYLGKPSPDQNSRAAQREIASSDLRDCDHLRLFFVPQPQGCA